MSHLLDINFLLACAWQTHDHHTAASAWLDQQEEFATCPISELGFPRVSMVFKVAKRDGLIADDPAEFVKTVRDRERRRYGDADQVILHRHARTVGV